MSNMIWLGSDTRVVMDPVVVGITAMLDVKASSGEFRTEVAGHGWPCGHKLRKFNLPAGITVAFKANAVAWAGTLQTLVVIFTSIVLVIGCAPGCNRLSNTLHGATT